MFKKTLYLWLFLIGGTVFIITGCGTGEQKSEAKNGDEPKSETTAIMKEHSDLVTKANQEIHNINQKLIELNDKIKAFNEKGRKLSEAQKKEIDEIEKIRASINPRIHEINKVSQENWENFKTTFEKDMEQVKSRIDTLVSEL